MHQQDQQGWVMEVWPQLVEQLVVGQEVDRFHEEVELVEEERHLLLLSPAMGLGMRRRLSVERVKQQIV